MPTLSWILIGAGVLGMAWFAFGWLAKQMPTISATPEQTAKQAWRELAAYLKSHGKDEDTTMSGAALTIFEEEMRWPE